MKTIVNRETATRREPRMSPTPRVVTMPASSRHLDQVWPGFTRAQLRDLVIDQIG
jgi:hypothetical protein